MAQMDRDGDGQVVFTEFEAWIAGLRQPPAQNLGRLW
eukprot:COSAG01_NODE_4478_length_4986_cov_3.398813_6_plen_37_part_00